MSQEGLRAEGLGLVRGRAWLARDISFAVAPGTGLLVQGPNGSGKSTLLRTLCGLLRPHQGRLAWHGAALPGALARLRQDLAFLGHADAGHPDLSPLENLSAAMAFAGEARATRELEDALAQLGLAPHRHRPGRHLSQGQQRRAALARLWLTRRPLWILDEPLAALDADGRLAFTRRLREHLHGGGLAVFSCHTDAWTRTDLPLQRLHWAH